MDTLIDDFKKVKQAAKSLKTVSEEKTAQVLLDLAKLLRDSVAVILKANQLDQAALAKDDPKFDRLVLTQERIEAAADDLASVAAIPYVKTRILEERTRPNGLKIHKVAVPLGVVAIIYESRPNVTLDAFALCFKSGNACILKGGKEAKETNQCLLGLIQTVLRQHDLDPCSVYLLPLTPNALPTLLAARAWVDVCIPRGSQSLIEFVRDHAKIPYIETGAGIVHTYLDKHASLEQSAQVIFNAKTRRVSVCNALDTLLVHQERLLDLPLLLAGFAEKQVELFADEPSHKVLQQCYPHALLKHAKPEHFGQEFLALRMAIKTVDSLEAAVKHIQVHSSGHSEAILTEDAASREYFLREVDAAAVYVNASTAFTDGGQFGMGAEIGISTQKLHARGPMALDALSTYQWQVFGDGHVRA